MSDFDSLLKEAEAVQAAMTANPPAPARAAMPPPEPLSMMDRLLAKVPTGLVNNPAVAGARNIVTAAASPVVGGSQLLANLMPDSTGVPQLYNRKVNEMEAANNAAKREQAPIMAATNDMVGNVISPTNLAIALRAGPAVTGGQRAIQGATVGGISGATAPTETGESGKYWGPKGLQTAVGTGLGSVLGPVLGAVMDRIFARTLNGPVSAASAGREADNVISGALKETGQRLEDIPAGQLQGLRDQVTQALSQGKKLDAAAALRSKDFQTEGVKPTLGWVTRDPGQWAEEQNVRGVKGAGEPVQKIIAEGNQAVTAGIGKYGNGAAEPYAASPKIADALRGYDAQRSSAVTNAYATARASAGKDLEIPMQGLAQDYADVLGRYSENVRKSLPTAAFEQYGLSKGTQGKVFTFEDASKLLQTINANKSNDPAVNAALGELRTAVKRAATDVDAAGGPFAPAVKLASQRFAEHEAVPAIDAAVTGQVDDRFIQRHIINNPSTPQVQKLAGLLREHNPEAFQEARAQIGAHLYDKAVATNTAGDKAIAQESYNKALRSLGTGKLEAFFDQHEVDQLKRLGRLAAYQTSAPAGAASNYSNTASTVANLLRSMGGYIPVAKGPVQFAGDKVAAFGAVRPEIPVSPNLSPEQRRAMSRALMALSGAGGAFGAAAVGQQP